MKYLHRLIFPVLLFSFTVSCHHGNNITISNGDDKLSINYSGDIRFNDEETGIQSISKNGYLKYIKNENKLIAESDFHGGVRYELYIDGRKISPSDPEGKSFVMEAVKDMIDVGFDARGRMERIYHRGGTRAVLNEVNNLKSDYLKAQYLEYLFTADSIQQGEMTEIARKIGTQLGSDYDKGRLLARFPVDYLKDSLTSHVWFESVKSIGSDYEKSNALVYIARQTLTREQFNQTADVANSIGSDYEKSNVLKELIFKRSFAEENFDKTLDAVSYIGSDYEKANLLKALIEREKPSADHFGKLLDVMAHVNSEYDRSNLIKELIETGVPDGVGFDKLISAVIHTGSEFDKANLLKDISSKNITTEEQWISIINATAEISSDNDKSNLLVVFAPNMPKSEKVKTAYLKVAKTINGEMELGRAIKAVD